MRIFNTRHNNTRSILITLENNSANYKVLQKLKMSFSYVGYSAQKTKKKEKKTYNIASKLRSYYQLNRHPRNI